MRKFLLGYRTRLEHCKSIIDSFYWQIGPEGSGVSASTICAFVVKYYTIVFYKMVWVRIIHIPRLIVPVLISSPVFQ
jgi:hypothetical protein